MPEEQDTRSLPVHFEPMPMPREVVGSAPSEPITPHVVGASGANTCIIDLDTGAYPLPSWPPNYGLPEVQLPGYLMQVLDARGAAVAPSNLGDTGGYGSHGTMMAGLAAAYSLLQGQLISVCPVIVGTPAGGDTNAIGRALLWAVDLKNAWPGTRWIVTIPWSRGYHGPMEAQGRKAAGKSGLLVIDSADIPPNAVPVPSLGTSGAAMFAAVNEALRPTR